MTKKTNDEAGGMKEFEESLVNIGDQIGEYLTPFIDQCIAEGLGNDEIDKRLEAVKEKMINDMVEKALADEQAKRRIELTVAYTAITKVAVDQYFRRQAIKDDPEYAKFLKEIESPPAKPQ